MTKFASFFHNLSLHTLKYIGLLFSGWLFICGLLFTSTDTDITTLPTTITSDNLVLGIGMLVFFLGIIFLLKFPCMKYPKATIRTLLALTLTFYSVAGVLLILYAKSVPHTDSYQVYNIALACAKNDLSGINPTEYLSVYPHQAGLVLYYEVLIRLFSLLGIQTNAYMWIQGVNLVLTLVMIYFMYKIVQKLFQNTYTTACFFVLMLFCFPLLFFILRVYGDIPSIAFFIVGLWAFMEILSFSSFKATEKKSRYVLLMALSILCFIFSVATRKNIIVCIIALMIIALLTAFYQKRLSLIVLFLCYLAVSICTLPIITHTYELRADNELDAGTPPLAFIAMGMQEAPRANGWYNAFNYNVYVESNHDLEFTTMYSKKLIKEKATYFMEHPQEAWDFYFEKFTSQWCDGTYASRELTAITDLERNSFFENFYGKEGGKDYIFFCNQYQNLVYMGTFIFCIWSCLKKNKTSVNLVLFAGVLMAFGGFLFHLLWEANVRAILPYMLLLIPSAAFGLSKFLTMVSLFAKK